MPAKPKLFSRSIQPSCSYCHYGSLSSSGSMILCQKHGVVSSDHFCRAFLYSPLKRVPKKPRKLPQFEHTDFEI